MTSQTRTFGAPITRHDGIAFPMQVVVDSPVAAQDLLHLTRIDGTVSLAVSQFGTNLAVVRAALQLTPDQARHAAKILNTLADEAERAGR